MPKPKPPVRPATLRPKTNTAAATTPTGAKPRPNPAPIKLSSGDAKLMAVVLMEMLKR